MFLKVESQQYRKNLKYQQSRRFQYGKYNYLDCSPSDDVESVLVLEPTKVEARFGDTVGERLVE